LIIFEKAIKSKTTQASVKACSEIVLTECTKGYLYNMSRKNLWKFCCSIKANKFNLSFLLSSKPNLI